MSKPRWLVAIEQDVQKVERKICYCSDCVYFGKLVKYATRRDGHSIEIHECDIHPGCLNTMFSICCDDWTPENLV